MTRRLMLIGTLAAFLFSVTPALAHDDYRIIGIVVKHSSKQLDVKRTKDGKVILIDMDDTTLVSRDKKKISPSELKVGTSVVVDARGDSEDELLAVEVKIVPAMTKR